MPKELEPQIKQISLFLTYVATTLHLCILITLDDTQNKS